MSTDTPSGESGDTALTVDGGAQAFADLLEPQSTEDDAPKVDTEIDPPKKKEEGGDTPEVEAEPNAAEEGDDAPITVMVDGKPVTLTKEQIAEAHKGQLRQNDYTQKTMALADARKAADAETQKAQAERVTYEQNLARMAALNEAGVQEQSKIDWDALLKADPHEYLQQQHLLQKRQATLSQIQAEQTRIAQQFQTEAAQARQSRLSQQQQDLLAKLPDWKDEAKAATEKKAIGAYLQAQGYKPDELNIEDHRAIVLSRKAMLYDQMMDKAKAAAKKIANVPTKVERPGTATERSPTDGRNAAMQRLNKTGSLESAAAVFAGLL